jgi:hypothetical protein
MLFNPATSIYNEVLHNICALSTVTVPNFAFEVDA